MVSDKLRPIGRVHANSIVFDTISDMEHELASVLNQLPPNAFDELFTGKKYGTNSNLHKECIIRLMNKDIELKFKCKLLRT